MSANIGVGLSRLRLKRLRGRELSVLLDAILPMEARLKERVAWLSQGNPAHAIQIVSYLRCKDVTDPSRLVHKWALDADRKVKYKLSWEPVS